MMMDNQYRELILSLMLAVLFPLLLGLAGGLIVEGLKAAFIVAIIIFPIVVVFRIVWGCYNIDKTADLILKRGFPEINADRLYLMSF
jgi:mannitol-specific phosphotransferase system IIBC component